MGYRLHAPDGFMGITNKQQITTNKYRIDGRLVGLYPKATIDQRGVSAVVRGFGPDLVILRFLDKKR